MFDPRKFQSGISCVDDLQYIFQHVYPSNMKDSGSERNCTNTKHQNRPHMCFSKRHSASKKKVICFLIKEAFLLALYFAALLKSAFGFLRLYSKNSNYVAYVSCRQFHQTNLCCSFAVPRIQNPSPTPTPFWIFYRSCI